MNYEEKYEKALEKAKKVYNDHRKDRYWRDWLTELFPELKESKAEWVEKIRKELKDYLGKRPLKKLSESDAVNQWIAWIEKQGEKLPVGFYYVDSNGNKYFSDTFKNGNFTFHVEKDEQISANSAKTCNDEQKHADNIEPKFKKGTFKIKKR